MTQRKTSRAESDPQIPAEERFPRPDAATTAQGAPAHEQEHEDDPPTEREVKRNDRAHGYSQDSGFQGSGGYAHKTAEATADDPPRSRGHSNGDGFGHTDAQIGRDVQQCLLGQPAPRGGRLLVSVGDGIVTLSGVVMDQAERRRLLELVRGVASVREVRDQLTVIPSSSGRPN